MSAERGNYRSIHRALLDDPDFEKLTIEAKLLLFIIKLQLGQSGIDVVYPGTLESVSGMDSKAIEKALKALSSASWIHTQGKIIWLRNGLRFEPHFNMENANHVKGIESHTRSLPKQQIVLEYCIYYGLAMPFETHSKPLRNTDTDTDTEYGIGSTDVPQAEPTAPKKRTVFQKPTLDEMTKYGQTIGLLPGNCEACRDYYEANGWHVGKSPMKNWEAAMRNWKKNENKFGVKNHGKSEPKSDRELINYAENIFDALRRQPDAD